MSRLDQADSDAIWAAVIFGVLMVLLVTAATLWPGDPTSDPCVPGYAVDYDGQLGAWLDRDGRIVLLAEFEDTYDWCTK